MDNRKDLGISGPRADAPWNTDKLDVCKVGDAVWLVGDESVTDLDEYAAVTNRELAKVQKLWGDREAFPGNVLFFTRNEDNVRQRFGAGSIGDVTDLALGYQIPQLGVRSSAGLKSKLCTTLAATLADAVLAPQDAQLRKEAEKWAKENAGSERVTTIGGIRLEATLDPHGMTATPGI